MKKVLSVAVFSAMVLTGSTCFGANDGSVYIKGAVKYVMPSDPEIQNMVEVESDNGYGFGGAVGMQFLEQFRVEAEIATQKTDVDALQFAGQTTGIGSGDIRITTYMVNGYYDIPVSNGFGIYLTGGLGLGTTTLSLYDIDGDDTGFAWKLGAGMFYAFDSNLFLDIGWEYVSLDDADFDVDVDDIYTNNISAAIRYHF